MQMMRHPHDLGAAMLACALVLAAFGAFFALAAALAELPDVDLLEELRPTMDKQMAPLPTLGVAPRPCQACGAQLDGWPLLFIGFAPNELPSFSGLNRRCDDVLTGMLSTTVEP